MKIKSSALINDLQERTRKNILVGERYKGLGLPILNFKENPDQWSMLECLEHLNLYGDFYLKEIENQIIGFDKKTSSPDPLFKSGLLGNYFAKMMLPKNGKVKKMKTFPDKNPIHSKLSTTAIDRFLKQQEKMLELLEMARKVDLNKVKTAISISKLVKLRLGDTFRVVVYHNDRHMLQAENVLKVALKSQGEKVASFGGKNSPLAGQPFTIKRADR